MGKSVLIVDDSKTMRKIITKTLRQANVDVENVMEAGDGQEALDQLQEETPDLILCDINMPNMDGIELLKRLKSNGPMQSIPVIMITTEGRSEDVVKKLIDMGAVATMGKPFTADQLHGVLQKVD